MEGRRDRMGLGWASVATRGGGAGHGDGHGNPRRSSGADGGRRGEGWSAARDRPYCMEGFAGWLWVPWPAWRPLGAGPRLLQFVALRPTPCFRLFFIPSFYSAIGGAAGLAFGFGFMGRGGAARGFLAGAMGATLGSVLFAVVHTLAFPLEWDFSPMPGMTLSRLLAHLCVAILRSPAPSWPCRAIPETSRSHGELLPISMSERPCGAGRS